MTDSGFITVERESLVAMFIQYYLACFPSCEANFIKTEGN